MNMNNNNNARYIERELRERSKRKHEDMFWDSSHRSTSTSSHIRISTTSIQDLPRNGPPLRNYNLHKGVHNFNSQTPLHKRVGTKPSTKQRKKYNLVITKITNTTLGDLEGPQTNFLTKQDPKG